MLELELTAAYAVWHAFADWQTLQPTPVQPSSQEQAAAVRFAKLSWIGASDRLVPWKMLPPHAGCSQVGPPKPTGHAQDVPLATP